MYTIDADKRLVDEELGNTAHRGRPDEGEPVAAEVSAADQHLNVVAIAQLHCDVDAVRNDCYPLAMHQAPSDLCCCGPRADRYSFAVGDQRRRSQANASLFAGVLFFLLLERRQVAKRLVQHRRYRDRTSVSAPEQTFVLEGSQLPANSR